MHNEETPSEEYLKRFNQGYLMAQYMPELADQLIPDIEKADSGLKAGMQQYSHERMKDLRPEWLKDDVILEQSTQAKEADKDNAQQDRNTKTSSMRPSWLRDDVDNDRDDQSKDADKDHDKE